MDKIIISQTIMTVNNLNERELLVILLRRRNKTLEEVAKIIGGVTRERIRQIEAKALLKIEINSKN